MSCNVNNDHTTQALVDLLPPGDAFPRVPGSNQERVLRGLAWPLTDAMEYACDISQTELKPGQHVDTLEDWENSFGIPSACTKRGETLSERQQSIKGRWTASGGSTIGYLEQVAADLGYDISVRASRPYRFGRERLGDKFGAYGELFVTVRGGPSGQLECIPYRFGRNRLGEPFTTCNIGELQCVFDRIVQAHFTITYQYEGV